MQDVVQRYSPCAAENLPQLNPVFQFHLTARKALPGPESPLNGGFWVASAQFCGFY
jgi:hypothetical protein